MERIGDIYVRALREAWGAGFGQADAKILAQARVDYADSVRRGRDTEDGQGARVRELQGGRGEQHPGAC
jgi:hypothetical protein